FEEQPLDLSGPCGFHVVYGPNEAGKSSALRGLHALLFGFPVQSGDDFRFRYTQFRIHASLVDSAGTTLECIRRKGKKATLLTADEKTEIPETSLTAEAILARRSLPQAPAWPDSAPWLEPSKNVDSRYTSFAGRPNRLTKLSAITRSRLLRFAKTPCPRIRTRLPPPPRARRKKRRRHCVADGPRSAPNWDCCNATRTPCQRSSCS